MGLVGDNMKKKLVKNSYLFILLIVLFSISVLVSIFKKEISVSSLEKAFKASKANFVSGEVYVWGKVEGYKNFNEVKLLADDFVSELGVLKNKGFSRSIISNDFIDKVEIVGSDREGKTISINAQLNKQKDSLGENYISISVFGDSPKITFKETSDFVTKLFRRHKIKPKANTCLTGFFNGELSHNNLNNIGKQILKDAKARKVNGIADRNLISVSAYSSSIDNSIDIDGKKVNMNLALRYNSYEDKTYIWLATPVITIEY